MNLIRLGEDLLHAFPIYHEREHLTPEEDQQHISSIANVISRYKTSPADLSSEEATALAETFHKVSFSKKNTLSISDASTG